MTYMSSWSRDGRRELCKGGRPDANQGADSGRTAEMRFTDSYADPLSGFARLGARWPKVEV